MTNLDFSPAEFQLAPMKLCEAIKICIAQHRRWQIDLKQLQWNNQHRFMRITREALQNSFGS